MTAVGPIESAVSTRRLFRPMTPPDTERAAHEQILPDATTPISYEDADGQWHDELSPGDDRPETDVKG